MTMYTLKPLVWEVDGRWKLCARTPIGEYVIFLPPDNDFSWGGPNFVGSRGARTVDEAKAAAEAHYIERMERGLEVVG